MTLLKQGEPVFGWVTSGYWEDVGNHAAYVKANFDCLEGRVKVDIPADRKSEGIWIHEEAEVSDGTRIDGPALICAGAKVRSGAWVNGPCVVGSYTTIDSGAKISNSILWDHSYVGLNARLRGAVVCRSVTIKNGCLLEEGSVIGSEVVLGTGATINPNVRIWPNKEVEPGAVVHESIIWAGSWRRGLFTSYGLSGLTNVEFTPEFASRFGAAVGALSPKGTEIAISRDYTRAARMLHRALISGMISSGADVTDLSVLPAPVARYWAGHNHVSAIHVQTSPVDPRSADIRLFDDHGLDIDNRTERKLEGLYFREDIRRVLHYEMGRIERRDSQTERYVEDMLAKTDLETVRAAAPKVFVDSPGERCFIVDETGEVLDHDTAFAVLSQLALAAKPGLVLGPASSSLAFSMIADEMNSRFVPTKITPGAVLRAAQHADTVLASDGTGGYCWPVFAIAFDAIFTTVRVVELLAQSGGSIAALRRKIPPVAHVKAEEFCPWDVKGRVMRTMMEKHLKDRVDLTDGVKVFVDGGWVLVVPDPDKPEYHIIASTLDPVRSAALVEEYSALVRSVVAEAAPESEGVVEKT